jgi:DNA end-binding protein Ku
VPRPIWKGSLSFGLVSVPVGLYPATTDKTLHFHQVQSGTSDRIRYKKVNERTGKEVANERIAKAMDTGGGEYVVLSDDELNEAEPEKSRTIDIEGFVNLSDIDPIYFRNSYYLAPQSDAATKAYQLLREAMDESDKIGVATFVMRNKEYLVAIRPETEVLVLETLYFSDEIRDPVAELPHLTDSTKVKPKERDMASVLIDSLAEEWDPSQYHDSYREHVEALVAKKQAGHDTISHVEPEEGNGKVIDLLEALQASVAKAGGRPSSSSTSNDGSTKKAAPGKARAAKKTKPVKKAASSIKAAAAKNKPSATARKRRAS